MTEDAYILRGLPVDGDSTSPKANGKGGGGVVLSRSDVL
jgi:hypothetical protein